MFDHQINLTSIHPREFLEDYWQKKPLKLDFNRLPAAVEPSALAAFFEYPDRPFSRLITARDESSGPERLLIENPDGQSERLQAAGQCLLINQAETVFIELAALWNAVHFIPNWRRSDIMLNISTEGGTVGPHVDQYDVILVQLSGQKKWRYEKRPCRPDNRQRQDGPIDWLDDFNADEEIIIEAGQALYLPPRLAHYGTAVGEGQTASLGFRMPAASRILHAAARTAHFFISDLPVDDLDALPARDESPVLISGTSLQHAWQQVKQQVDKLLADPHDSRLSELAAALGGAERDITPWPGEHHRKDFEKHFKKEGLYTTPGIYLSVYRHGLFISLFTGDRHIRLFARHEYLARALGSVVLEASAVQPRDMRLVYALYRMGYLYLPSEQLADHNADS